MLAFLDLCSIAGAVKLGGVEIYICLEVLAVQVCDSRQSPLIVRLCIAQRDRIERFIVCHVDYCAMLEKKRRLRENELPYDRKTRCDV